MTRKTVIERTTETAARQGPAASATGHARAAKVASAQSATIAAQRTAVEDLQASPRLAAQRRQMSGLLEGTPVQRAELDGANTVKDNKFAVEIGRSKKYEDPEEGTKTRSLTPKAPITVGDLKDNESPGLYARLREPEKDKLAPKSEHQVTRFSVRKPEGKSGHWAMYFVVDRVGKNPKSLKVDLYERGYRAIYQEETSPHSGFEGEVEWFAVDSLPIASVYSYLSGIATDKGAYGALGEYDCHAFVDLMLIQLGKHGLKKTRTDLLQQGRVVKETSHL